MKCDWVLNCGIQHNHVLDIESNAVRDFAEKLVQDVPELAQVERDKSQKKLSLFEQGKEGWIRRVEISQTAGLQIATSQEITMQQQAVFVRKVIDNAEDLEISKLEVNTVDVRKIFYVKHWGNHHELLAKALFKGGILWKMFEKMDTPISNLDMSFNIYPKVDDEDIVFGVWANPRTRRREIRSGNYDGDNLILVCGLGRTGGFVKFKNFWEMFSELFEIWKEGLTESVRRHLVKPLRNIAMPEQPKT